MKNIDDLENFWKRFCANPVKTLAYSVVLIVITLGSVILASYANGYFTELGKQAKTAELPHPASAQSAVTPQAAVPAPVSAASEPARAIAGDVAAARSTYPADLLRMRELADAITGGDKRSAQLLRLVGTGIQRGELAFAVETARAIPYERMRSDALAQVADAYAQKGDRDGALSVAQAIPTASVRSKVLSKLSSV